MKKKNPHTIKIIMSALFLLSMLFVAKKTAEITVDNNIDTTEKCVVIDAGHGGDDPGKVGVNGLLEKDINLAIAKRLSELLRQQDVKVIMTRETDKGLSKEKSSNKKVEDMKKRIEIIELSKPQIAVSIHQNSYHTEPVYGAQVFYYTSSKKGKEIAQMVQRQLIKGLDPLNDREAKGNDSYYLLRKTNVPIIIVECGFLSNWKEAELLGSEEYQEKIAWNLQLAIMNYLNADEKS